MIDKFLYKFFGLLDKFGEHLDKVFFPMAEEWFKRYKSINSTEAIKDNQKKYKKVRAELLELE